MKIVLTGGTGFLGTALCHALSQNEHELVLLSRRDNQSQKLGKAIIRSVQWNPLTGGVWQHELDGASVVINLAGKNLFEDRWNAKVKKAILDSRIATTQKLVEALRAAKHKPELFISASAIGYYGNCGEEILNEQSASGNDFLSNVVRDWEREACAAEQLGIRVAVPRIGIVLDRSEGIVQRMLLPFSLFAGGVIGSGEQFLSWIHLQDVVRGILYPIENKNFSGKYNLTSPNSVTMKYFCNLFGNTLHRPAWFPIPAIALKILFGEVANVIVSGQRVFPEHLLNSGFTFSYPNVESALRDVLK